MEATSKVKCPACKLSFNLDDQVEEADRIFCPNCNVELEVYSLDTPKVILADSNNYDDNEFIDDYDDYEYNEDDFFEDDTDV